MQKKYGVICVTAILLSNGLLLAEPNQPAAAAMQPLSTQQNAAMSSVGNVRQDEKLSEFEKRLLREQIESYKESVSCLKWAIGSLIGLSLAAVGFVVFKNERAYKEALAETRDAAKQSREEARIASDHREKAQEWERKAKEKYEEIDAQIQVRIEDFNKQADEKFKEVDNKIEELGDKVAKRVIRESQKQRELSEKWNKALMVSRSGDYEQANQLWAEFIKENPKNYQALNQWGNLLSDWAELGGTEAKDRCQKACEKYAAAVELSPNYDPAFSNWSIALSEYAKLVESEEANELYRQACNKCERAAEINPKGSVIFHNWGGSLHGWAKLGGPESETRYLLACEKFKTAIQLAPHQPGAFNGYGVCLLGLACLKDGQEKMSLCQEAEKVLLKAESIRHGEGAFNLACLFAFLNNEDKCREWLKVAEETKILPNRDYVSKIKYLDIFRDKDWFKAIRWKGE